MKLSLLCTSRGLIPLYDEDYEAKKKLAVGKTYLAEIKIPRNYEFLKKAFALLNAAWSLMNEKEQAAWRSRDGFRDYLTVAAGYYTVYFNPRLKEFVEVPRSWRFDSMDEPTFNDLYERMKDVIFGILGNRISEEVFETVLANF